MRNYHIMVWDKYVNEYINFINNNFNNEEHIFLVIEGKALANLNGKILDYDNVISFKNRYIDIIKINKIINKADNIILHGLFNTKIVCLLFFNRKILNKSNWMIWGGDLYYYKYRKKTIRSDIKEFIRKQVISNLKEITSLIKGDYDIAKSIYKTNAKYNYASYILPVNFDMLDDLRLEKCNLSKEIYIQIGNSADRTNNHKEVLLYLEKYKNENIKILCPLSYGDKEYANEIIYLGEKIFEDKFIKITKYLSPDEYSKILSKVDIAIFNHERQQGLGNILALLYLGKKVYIRRDITPWKYFSDKNINLYDTIGLENMNFEEFKYMDNEIRLLNKSNVSKEFSKENYIKMWGNIFNN